MGASAGYIAGAVGVAVLFYLFNNRKKASGTGPAKPPVTPPVSGGEDKITTERKVIIVAKEPRMMSVAYHDGQIVGGTYNNNRQNYACWEDGLKVALGDSNTESVYDLKSFPGVLAASLEKFSEVENARNGARLRGNNRGMVTATREVSAGIFASVSCTAFTGDIYFKMDGQAAIRLTSTGDWFCRDMIARWNMILINASRYIGGTVASGVFASTNGGRSFEWRPLFTKEHFRPMDFAELPNDELSLTFSKYNDNERIGGGALKLNQELLYTVQHFDNKHGGWFGNVAKPNGDQFCAALNWNGGGTGAIWTNQNGKWEIFATVNGEVLRLALTPYNTLAAAVKEDGVGKVIEYGDRSKKLAVPDVGDRTVMPNVIRYKVRSEVNGVRKGDLVILLPSSMGNVPVVMGAGTDQEEHGRFVEFGNGDRATYRFNHPGFWWKSPCPINIGPNRWVIEDTARDNRYGFDYVK